MPHLPNRLYLRAASKIHERLTICKPQPLTTEIIEMDWRRFHRYLRLLRQARHRKWLAAEKIYKLRLERSTQELRTSLERIFPDRQPFNQVASVLEIYRDLVALEKEFSEVSIDLQEREISVRTEPLVLEEVELGPFEMILSWEQLSNCGRPYRIEALEPNPAASSDEITHPHVQDKTLCEGDARPMLELALQSGRLFEFFLVVVQTLRTYNPDSPFVSLAQWFGVPCHDCGSTVDEEDRIRCEHCEVIVCSECYACCASCDRCCCAGCYTTCSSCDEVLCDACRLVCECCQQPYCERCLDHENCKTCEANKEETSSDYNRPDATLQSHHLGQIGLPA